MPSKKAASCPAAATYPMASKNGGEGPFFGSFGAQSKLTDQIGHFRISENAATDVRRTVKTTVNAETVGFRANAPAGPRAAHPAADRKVLRRRARFVLKDLS